MRIPGRNFAAPAKLNLFLHVVGRRADGYHLLQSVFTLIDLHDVVRIHVNDTGEIGRVEDLPGIPMEQDLSVRAARLLQAETGTTQGAHLGITKRIPMGAGLGGGSSDAATTLWALNHLWKTGLSPARLRELGATLGADVPFFLLGENAWVEGIGERLTPLALPPRWYVVLVPPVHVPTPTIFAAPELTRNTRSVKMADFSATSGGYWSGTGPRYRNDLEAVVVNRFPEVREHLEWLARRGEARLTGSGACVFAGYETRERAEQVLRELPASMKGFVAQGLQEHPLRRM